MRELSGFTVFSPDPLYSLLKPDPRSTNPGYDGR